MAIPEIRRLRLFIITRKITGRIPEIIRLRIGNKKCKAFGLRMRIK
jgi:hypothetical protein